MSLSDKIFEDGDMRTEDVREAVRELKDFINEFSSEFTNVDWGMIQYKIDEIFGERLV